MTAKLFYFYFCILINMLSLVEYVANIDINDANNDEHTCDQQLYQKPICIDQISNYKCKCDIGFVWNGYRCISTALNSYFEFPYESTALYVIFEKTFPTLNSFTITFWLQFNQSSSFDYKTDTRSIFSYSFGENINALKFKVGSSKINSLNEVELKVEIKLLNDNCLMRMQHLYVTNSSWIHFSVAWKSNEGIIDVFVNGKQKSSCSNMGKGRTLERAGNFILGQSYQSYQLSMSANNLNDSLNKNTLKFEEHEAFIGRLFNFNVWNKYKEVDEIFGLYIDCRLKYCGNAAQWSDFRQGTRGDIKFKWPTDLILNKECMSAKYTNDSCNQFCYEEIGPICRNEIEQNINWPLTKANVTSKMLCVNINKTMTDYTIKTIKKYAYRTCNHKNDDTYIIDNDNSINKYLGSWSTSNLDECVQHSLKALRDEAFVFHTTDNFDEANILVYLQTLRNLTISLRNSYESIHDITTIIDTLQYLVNAQHQVIKQNLDLYYLPSINYDEFKEFTRILLSIINDLLSLSNEPFWNDSLPIGSQSIRIVNLIKELSLCIYDFQRLYHIKSAFKSKEDKFSDTLTNDKNSDFWINSTFYDIFNYKFTHIVFTQKLLYADHKMQLNFKFPDVQFVEIETQTNHPKTTNSMSRNNTLLVTNKKADKFNGQIIFNKHIFVPTNKNKNTPNYYGLVMVYYSGIEKLLPNHNKTFRAKDNNINSILLTLDLINGDKSLTLNERNFNQTFDKPFHLLFNYTNNNNISDTRCVKLENLARRTASFKWSRQNCKLKQEDQNSALCECSTLGTFSITNNLYDPNWKPTIIENIPLIFFSYVGCIYVVLCSSATFICLVYLKTKSVATSVHKNLCIAVALSQLFYMISLTNYKYDKDLCKALTLISYYLLISVFAWLANEAFNLYITITYAAHQSGHVTETVPQWRFYVIGWVVPAIWVGCLFLIKSNECYSPKICWFNLDYIWLLLSPVFVFILITILVMIFSAKEHSESSYTKNEKANKLILNHTKAVWTQIILLSISWSFSFTSLKILGAVIKYLQAFLNCLQGLFLFIFYFLLNDEVRKILRDRKRQRRLNLKHINEDDEDEDEIIHNFSSKNDDGNFVLKNTRREEQKQYLNKFNNLMQNNTNGKSVTFDNSKAGTSAELNDSVFVMKNNCIVGPKTTTTVHNEEESNTRTTDVIENINVDSLDGFKKQNYGSIINRNNSINEEQKTFVVTNQNTRIETIWPIWPTNKHKSKRSRGTLTETEEKITVL